ncbi:MAG: hypothetical protein CMF96_00705 [Candidatus Marinimicrobia bacterium]|nr:hypothetical protein [Candidatus Neomarinimicrobiota bacterium]|tara:strand:- start:7642 stop:8028 length:387 start_codon:yes stop_codon:yes gene_type:complete
MIKINLIGINSKKKFNLDYILKFLFLFMISLFFSCTSYEDMLYALETKQSLEKLEKGMKTHNVIQIVGEPLKKSFTQDSTEVWIYITSIPQTAFIQSVDNLSNDYKTALIFKNKILISWGNEAKNYIN